MLAEPIKALLFWEKLKFGIQKRKDLLYLGENCLIKRQCYQKRVFDQRGSLLLR